MRQLTEKKPVRAEKKTAIGVQMERLDLEPMVDFAVRTLSARTERSVTYFYWTKVGESGRSYTENSGYRTVRNLGLKHKRRKSLKIINTSNQRPAPRK